MITISSDDRFTVNRVTVRPSLSVVLEVRLRDGDQCRWCGSRVSWVGGFSRRAGTYDELEAGGGFTVQNTVIACRRCNSDRRDGWNLDLRPVPDAPRYVPETREFLRRTVESDVDAEVQPAVGEDDLTTLLDVRGDGFELKVFIGAGVRVVHAQDDGACGVQPHRGGFPVPSQLVPGHEADEDSLPPSKPVVQVLLQSPGAAAVKLEVLNAAHGVARGEDRHDSAPSAGGTPDATPGTSHVDDATLGGDR